MSYDAEAQEVHPTVTSPESRRGPRADGTAEPAGLGGEKNATDPDAVIIEEDAAIFGEAPPAPASGRPGRDPGAAEANPAGATSAGAARTTSADAARTTPADGIPESARPQAPADGDAGMAGDPERIHERWAAIQARFVDDPRESVAAAADLVTETIATLVARAEQRERGLRGEWDREGADTENLRNTLRSYRGLLDRLAAV
jgi:hypothetical protein